MLVFISNFDKNSLYKITLTLYVSGKSFIIDYISRKVISIQQKYIR